MALEKRDRFAPSRRPYALDLSDARQNDLGHRWTMAAIWAGRKNGVTTVTFGELRVGPGYWHVGDDSVPLERAIEIASMAYGGDWHWQWDGERLLVEPTHHLGPEQQVRIAETMDAVLQAFPAVPDGYDGWYYRA